jgi:ribosomal protein S18 acetylase RimI-like enzyme
VALEPAAAELIAPVRLPADTLARMARPEALRWSLRPAEQADFDWAYELHKAALGEYVERTWGWEEEAQRTMFADAFSRQPRQVIEVDGRAVGVLVVDERSGELYLGLIELLPAWQGRGLGTDILRCLLRRARETQRPLTLHVLRANPRAVALYEREGLRVVLSEPVRLLMRSGAVSQNRLGSGSQTPGATRPRSPI